MIHPWYSVRVEPTRPSGDAERGFRAELADPAWMIGRQWQLGELRGENASSPIQVSLRPRKVAIRASAHRRFDDPKRVPTEVIVESGPDDWWTPSRRIRLGRAAERAGVVDRLAATRSADEIARLRCRDLPAPYDALNGRVWDGLAVYRRAGRDPVFAEVPPAGRDAWRSDELVYQASFPAGGTSLDLAGHDGGTVDWWTVDALGSTEARRPARERRLWPQRFEWPGGPARRWWQIEDHHVDLGGRPPDRAHLATIMLLDLVMGHGDDWFLVPVPSVAGHVLTVTDVEIVDAFGDVWTVPDADPAVTPAWTMFAVAGLGDRTVPIWLTAPAPLEGPPIEEVAVGVDEDANVVWAVEERLGGRATDRSLPSAAEIGTAVVDENAPLLPPPDYRYTPVTAVPPHWTPYTREDALDTPDEVRFRQGRLVSINQRGTPTRAPIPTAKLLQPTSGGGGKVHEIVPWRLPPTGVRLERRAMLTRDVDGNPCLWIQRRRVPLLGAPTSALAFDRSEPIRGR